MQRQLAAIALICGPAVSGHAQPVSVGLAQCSAMIGVMETYSFGPSDKSRLARASDSLLAAARVQARSEGRAVSEILAARAQKQTEWSRLGNSEAFDTEYRDWSDYCRLLEREHDFAFDWTRLR